jgi:DNA-binding NtrC family response regulator
VQVIAASNRDMREEVRKGQFRSDLYHRLSLHRLHLPPLRDRIEDVPLIVEHFARRHFRRDIRFAQDALDMLMSYPFPGNVRELENMVRGTARMSPDGVVYAVDLCSYIELVDERPDAKWERPNGSTGSNPVTPNVFSTDEGLEEQVHRFKLQIVKETLAKHNGNATRAALSLKISRPSLYRLLRDIKSEEVTIPDAGCEFTMGHDLEGQKSVSAGVS